MSMFFSQGFSPYYPERNSSLSHIVFLNKRWMSVHTYIYTHSVAAFIRIKYIYIYYHSQNLAVASRGFDFDICSDHPARVSTIPNDFVGHRLAEYSLQLWTWNKGFASQVISNYPARAVSLLAPDYGWFCSSQISEQEISELSNCSHNTNSEKTKMRYPFDRDTVRVQSKILLIIDTQR